MAGAIGSRRGGSTSGAEADSAIGQTSLAYAFDSAPKVRADGLTPDTSSFVRLVIVVMMGCMNWSTAVAVAAASTGAFP
jgi:hypothetical protein